jgi:hypothetical protein
VEDGRLLWAFDIRSRGAVKRNIRVLRPCVAAYAERCPCPLQGLAAVLDYLLPAGMKDPHATSVRRLFGCSQAHIARLIADGLLRVTVPSAARSGPSSSPKISRESLVSFLTERRFR